MRSVIRDISTLSSEDVKGKSLEIRQEALEAAREGKGPIPALDLWEAWV